MIQYLSLRSCSWLAFFAILLALLSTSAASHGHSTKAPTPTAAPTTAPSSCSAEITINSTQYGTAFYIYHDIIVENTGLCDITRVLVDITLPPNDSVFLYYNVSNTTGELFGVSFPMSQGSVQTGGTLVMNSARIPLVALGKLECSTTCNSNSDKPAGSSDEALEVPPPSSPSSPSGDESSSSSTIQIAIKSGSNPYWFGLNVLSGGATVKPANVQFRDSSSGASWVPMNVANWGTQPTYTYSPISGPLALPLSLKITNSNGDTVLDNIITSFSQATYSSTINRAAQQNEGGDVTAF